MEDFKSLIKKNYLQYASYVILDRAIPCVDDGLKPVQRRILHTLYSLDDGNFHKVANVVGQTMAYHPHGDAAINDALVNLANRGYLLDRQGNFGNLHTGDPAAAARYIETRLSPLAKETLFNPDLTTYIPSYDGRNQEPTSLPAKVPLVLLQGVEGIAVGMSTRIMPHNFEELLQAEIDLLQGREVDLVPDFLSGGIMDASQYDKGKGKIKLRAKIIIRNEKTLIIREICYGTTTESVIKSVDEAAKKGKIKIDSISDYTAENVEIEITLPRGQYAQKVIHALYAHTECEVSINTNCLVIKDNYPWETDVNEILKYHVNCLQHYLKTELEIERDNLLQKIFDKTLEQIFIENRLYKLIEDVKTYSLIITTIDDALKPFLSKLDYKPRKEDIERLLAIPIRRISRFDIEKNQKDIAEYQVRLQKIEKDLKNIKSFTIRYIQKLIKKYGEDHPRRTKLQTIEEVDKRIIDTKKIKVGFDPEEGFVGTKVSSDITFECTNFDKILLMYKDGTYTVINIPEKQYVQHDGIPIVYVAPADKKTTFRVVYRDLATKYCYVKSFIIKQFILEKAYHYLDDNTQLELITTEPHQQVELRFIPKPKQKITKMTVDLDEISNIKSVSAKGVRIAKKEVKKVKLLKRKAKAAKND
ncbi:MAG: DNA topoisomerase IV subunit A [Chlamydiota bacterium]